MDLRCVACGERSPHDPLLLSCPRCGEALEVLLAPEVLAGKPEFAGRGVWRYGPLLPGGPAVSLGEGDTGLHRCERLGRDLGIPRLFVKNEGENPTGSFKDRGMTVGISLAIAAGVRAVACASTGNTSASMAAYAARAGLPAFVLVPAGRVAAGKLSQAVAHGAAIAEVEGSFDEAMELVLELARTRREVYLLNSINPYRLEGQKTLAFEVCEALGEAPDAVVLPMGNAGNVSAVWKGFQEFRALGRIGRLPRMIGVQAEGAAPLVRVLRDGASECRVERPETVATAIRIGAPVNWRKAVAAVRLSGGEAGTVTDAEILAAQRDLARLEGLFVEPAAASPIAYLRKRRIPEAATVVCVATGHGLKDPDAVGTAPVRRRRVPANLEALRAAFSEVWPGSGAHGLPIGS
ncbi:MAG: threonine synthase [Planctomycetes bacterium]|nr:threonine synthase [Planctomycetota bacterium]